MSIQKWLLYIACGLAIAVLMLTFIISKENGLAIDVGHSKLRPGAVSAHGKPEFEFNLALAQTINDLMTSNGIPVVRIGYAGDMVDLKKRTQLANASSATFFLSIHHDSVQTKHLKKWKSQGITRKYTDHVSGFSLFVSRKNPELATSLNCASSIGFALKQKGFHPSRHHSESISGEHKEWADKANGVYYYDDLVVLKTATIPAVLLEAGVIVNRQEERYIQKSEVRSKIAMAIQNGLLNCGGIKPALYKEFTKMFLEHLQNLPDLKL